MVKVRKQCSAEGLLSIIDETIKNKIKEPIKSKGKKPIISLSDCIKSGLAILILEKN